MALFERINVHVCPQRGMTIWIQDYIYHELENLRIMDVGAWIVIMGEEILRRNEVGQHRLMEITWH